MTYVLIAERGPRRILLFLLAAADRELAVLPSTTRRCSG